MERRSFLACLLSPLIPIRAHPLIGVSPMYACGADALKALTIKPGYISPEQADRLRKYWEESYSSPAKSLRIATSDGVWWTNGD